MKHFQLRRKITVAAPGWLNDFNINTSHDALRARINSACLRSRSACDRAAPQHLAGRCASTGSTSIGVTASSCRTVAGARRAKLDLDTVRPGYLACDIVNVLRSS